MTYTCHLPSPVGELTLASDGEHLVGLWIEGQKYYASTVTEAVEEEDIPAFAQTKDWLDIYFQGREPEFCPPLAPVGSAFRQAVWRILLEIPYGQTITYGGIAERLEGTMGEKRKPAQAVGGAVGHNPISIIIPCHRVVGKNGSLTGYAGGIEKKIKLLQLEGVPMQGLFIPKKGTAL